MEEKIYKLNIRLFGLLNNSDNEYISNLIGDNDSQINNLLNKKVGYGMINDNLSVNVRENDTIDYIKKKIVIEILKELKYEERKDKICVYCFKKSDNDGIKNVIHEIENNKILECKNCKKVYRIEEDILYKMFPVPEYIYLWKDNIQIGHSLKKRISQKEDLNLEIDDLKLISPFQNIEKYIKRPKFKKKNDLNEYLKIDY